MSSKYPDDPFLTLSSPDFHAKHPPLVKLTRDEKIGNLSNPAVLFYVNPKALSTPLVPVEKSCGQPCGECGKVLVFNNYSVPLRIPSPLLKTPPQPPHYFPQPKSVTELRHRPQVMPIGIFSSNKLKTLRNPGVEIRRRRRIPENVCENPPKYFPV